MNLSIAYKIEEGNMGTLQSEYLNFIATYMLHTLDESQSMAKLAHEFKNDPHQPNYDLCYFALCPVCLLPCKPQIVEGQGCIVLQAGFF
jgi:hypothetical protein